MNPVKALFVVAMMLAASSTFSQDASLPAPGLSPPTILYGAAYYNEYMPTDLQPGRLDKDVALMKAAGITVVRMGESTWSLWEPADALSMRGWIP
jgi:beta-galactosidase